MHIIAMTKHTQPSQFEELEKHSCANVNVLFVFKLVSAFENEAGVVVKSFKSMLQKRKRMTGLY